MIFCDVTPCSLIAVTNVSEEPADSVHRIDTFYHEDESILPSLNAGNHLRQCFSTFVRVRPGKFFFYKMWTRSQQIYS